MGLIQGLNKSQETSRFFFRTKKTGFAPGAESGLAGCPSKCCERKRKRWRLAKGVVDDAMSCRQRAGKNVEMALVTGNDGKTMERHFETHGTSDSISWLISSFMSFLSES